MCATCIRQALEIKALRERLESLELIHAALKASYDDRERVIDSLARQGTDG
jgi:hypothetical protein